MNKMLLLKAAAAIRESATFDQRVWVNGDGWADKPEAAPPGIREICGTPGCVAGHIVAAHGYGFECVNDCDRYMVVNNDGMPILDGNIETVAMSIGGIEEQDAVPMFDQAPARNPDPSPRAAADMLERYVATGRVEWHSNPEDEEDA